MSEHIYTSPRAVKLTKSDTAEFNNPRALWVGTAGTANMVDAGGNTLTDFPLKEGLCPLRIIRLKTGGTADDIFFKGPTAQNAGTGGSFTVNGTFTDVIGP